MPRLDVNDSLGVYSHYTQEVLGTIPSGTVRWGACVVLACVASLFAVGWWVKYPVTLAAEAKITTASPPASVIARATGKFEKIFVNDQQRVEKGDILAIVESSASSADVLSLIEKLKNTSAPVCASALDYDNEDNPSFGGLQDAFGAFRAYCGEYREYQEQRSTERQVVVLEELSGQTSRLIEALKSQSAPLAEHRSLLEKDLNRLSQLRDRKLVSQKQVEEREVELLAVRRAQQQWEAELQQRHIELRRIESERLSKLAQDQAFYQRINREIYESQQVLLARLRDWEETYVLRAPISGKVVFFDYWSSNQFVQSGAEVMTLVPLEQERLEGHLRVALRNSGKIELGQSVHIRLDAYPYHEYGLVTGVVSRMSPIPRQDFYAVDVALPVPLRTSFGKELETTQEMTGRAEILTKEARLIVRLFQQLLAPLVESRSE